MDWLDELLGRSADIFLKFVVIALTLAGCCGCVFFLAFIISNW